MLTRFAKLAVLALGALSPTTFHGLAAGQESPAQISSQRGEFRTWSDRSGKFHTEAVFIEVTEGKVSLKKRDGTTISVPLEKLSDADQEYVRSLGKEPAERNIAGSQVSGALSPEQQGRLKERGRLWQENLTLQAVGKMGEARNVVAQALAIDRELAAVRPAQLADTLQELARLCALESDFGAAREAADECLQLRRKLLGESHYQVIDARMVLADVELQRGLTSQQRQQLAEAYGLTARFDKLCEHARYAEAISTAKRQLGIRGEILGKNHRFYASSLHRLATAYEAVGDHAQSEALFRQAIEIEKKTLGELHPNYAGSLNNLGAVYNAKGDYAQAELLFRRAAEITKKTLGESHPEYARSLDNLAMGYVDMGEYARAESAIPSGTGDSEERPR